jgi:protein SCO1/2
VAGLRRQTIVGFVALIGLAALAALVLLRSKPEAAPPVLQAIPPFTLVDEQGRPFGSADLKGTMYAADFIYTGCTDSCPLLTARMGELQERLRHAGPELRLISFTVDPGRDSPPKLLEYAKHAHYDPARWTFLTGTDTAMEALLTQGFKVAMYREVHDGGATPEELIHDEHLVLVDGMGRLRGYYAANAEGLGKLLGAVKYLATHRPQ